MTLVHMQRDCFLVNSHNSMLSYTDTHAIWSDALISSQVELDSNGRSEYIREATCEWFERHGVDPQLVCVPGWAVRDLTNRCIVWWGDDATVCPCVPDCDSHGRVMVEQLEAEPLPWPFHDALVAWGRDHEETP